MFECLNPFSNIINALFIKSNKLKKEKTNR